MKAGCKVYVSKQGTSYSGIQGKPRVFDKTDTCHRPAVCTVVHITEGTKLEVCRVHFRMAEEGFIWSGGTVMDQNTRREYKRTGKDPSEKGNWTLLQETDLRLADQGGTVTTLGCGHLSCNLQPREKGTTVACLFQRPPRAPSTPPTRDQELVKSGRLQEAQEVLEMLRGREGAGLDPVYVVNHVRSYLMDRIKKLRSL